MTTCTRCGGTGEMMVTAPDGAPYSLPCNACELRDWTERALKAERDLADWQSAIQSVAIGCIPSIRVVRSAIEELRAMQLRAATEVERLRIELETGALNAAEVDALVAWADEQRRPDGCSGWGPRFDAAMDVALRLRDERARRR